MRHFKRSDYRDQTKRAINSFFADGDIQSQISLIWESGEQQEDQTQKTQKIQREIDLMWKSREKDLAQKIQKETDLAWAEHDKLIKDDFLNEDYTIEVDECKKPEDTSFEGESFDLEYQKDKRRSKRRKANVRAKKRLIRNADIAQKSLPKREAEDVKNGLSYIRDEDDNDSILYIQTNGKDVKSSRGARALTLQKRASKFAP